MYIFMGGGDCLLIFSLVCAAVFAYWTVLDSDSASVCFNSTSQKGSRWIYSPLPFANNHLLVGCLWSCVVPGHIGAGGQDRLIDSEPNA